MGTYVRVCVYGYTPTLFKDLPLLLLIIPAVFSFLFRQLMSHLEITWNSHSYILLGESSTHHISVFSLRLYSLLYFNSGSFPHV